MTLVTGFDIIFFWVARMIMFGLKFMDDVPFKEVYITGLIRDHDGQKMSKSKGNVIDPLDLVDGVDLETLVKKRTTGLMQPEMADQIEAATRKQFPKGIEAYGVDALRFTYCSLASTGRDINFDLARLLGYKSFCNKLWNATRYVLMQTESGVVNTPSAALSVVDRWILSRLQKTIQAVHEHLRVYRFDLLAQTLYEFSWREFCDWYLELTKPILSQTGFVDAETQQSTRNTLIAVLESLLRLLHPVIPFVTESLWQAVLPRTKISGESIMTQPFPEFNVSLVDEVAEADVAWIQSFILAIRNIRGEMTIAPGKLLTVLLRQGTAEDRARVKQYQSLLTSLDKISSLSWLEKDATPPVSATALVKTLELLIPMAEVIDVSAERERLKKEIAKLEKDLEKTKAKLENPEFVNKAPEAVVAKDRKRAEEMQQMLDKYQEQLRKIH
jgi:valyl-tRNA synthetase